MINWQSGSFSRWLRVIATVTTLLFTVNTVAWADGNHLAQSFQQLTKPEPAKASLFDSLALPDSIGQIKTSFQGSRDRIVVHIQDAHVNEEAQRNIGKILDYFSKRHGVKRVSLEGAEGDLYPELFSFFPDKKARRNVADYFLKEALLTGPEYLAIVENPEIKLYGVEEKEVYEENRKAYLAAVELKERDEEVLAEVGKVLEDVSRYVFSDELRELLQKRSAFQEGGRELVQYIRYLVQAAEKHKIALFDYPVMHSLLSLVELESGIDFEKAEREIDELTADLKKLLSREKLSRFLTNSVQFRIKKMRRSEYYGYLEEEIKGVPGTEVSLQQKYANVLKYLQYMRLYDAIDIRVFDEIESLEKGIKNKLFRSEEEVALDRLYRIFDIYQKMFDFSLTKQDADFFYTYRTEFKTESFETYLTPLLEKHHFSYDLPKRLGVLDEDLPRVEAFYAAALKRDRILIERAVEKMEAEKEKITALVTGGFHTPGIEKYLREHDYSYLVIAPRISKEIDHSKEARLYEEAIQQKPLSMEKLLVEAFFPPKSAALNDPRFQLSAPRFVPSRTQGEEFLYQIGNGASREQLEERAGQILLYLLMEGTEELVRHGSVEKAVEAWKREQAQNPRAPRQIENLIKVFAQGSYFEEPSEKKRFFVPGIERGDKTLVLVRYPVEVSRNEVRSDLGLYRPNGEIEPVPVDGDLLEAIWADKLFVEGLRNRITQTKARAEVRHTPAAVLERPTAPKRQLKPAQEVLSEEEVERIVGTLKSIAPSLGELTEGERVAVLDYLLVTDQKARFRTEVLENDKVLGLLGIRQGSIPAVDYDLHSVLFIWKHFGDRNRRGRKYLTTLASDIKRNARYDVAEAIRKSQNAETQEEGLTELGRLQRDLGAASGKIKGKLVSDLKEKVDQAIAPKVEKPAEAAKPELPQPNRGVSKWAKRLQWIGLAALTIVFFSYSAPVAAAVGTFFAASTFGALFGVLLTQFGLLVLSFMLAEYAFSTGGIAYRFLQERVDRKGREAKEAAVREILRTGKPTGVVLPRPYALSSGRDLLAYVIEHGIAPAALDGLAHEKGYSSMFEIPRHLLWGIVRQLERTNEELDLKARQEAHAEKLKPRKLQFHLVEAFKKREPGFKGFWQTVGRGFSGWRKVRFASLKGIGQSVLDILLLPYHLAESFLLGNYIPRLLWKYGERKNHLTQRQIAASVRYHLPKASQAVTQVSAVRTAGQVARQIFWDESVAARGSASFLNRRAYLAAIGKIGGYALIFFGLSAATGAGTVALLPFTFLAYFTLYAWLSSVMTVTGLYLPKEVVKEQNRLIAEDWTKRLRSSKYSALSVEARRQIAGLAAKLQDAKFLDLFESFMSGVSGSDKALVQEFLKENLMPLVTRQNLNLSNVAEYSAVRDHMLPDKTGPPVSIWFRLPFIGGIIRWFATPYRFKALQNAAFSKKALIFFWPKMFFWSSLGMSLILPLEIEGALKGAELADHQIEILGQKTGIQLGSVSADERAMIEASEKETDVKQKGIAMTEVVLKDGRVTLEEGELLAAVSNPEIAKVLGEKGEAEAGRIFSEAALNEASRFKGVHTGAAMVEVEALNIASDATDAVAKMVQGIPGGLTPRETASLETVVQATFNLQMAERLKKFSQTPDDVNTPQEKEAAEKAIKEGELLIQKQTGEKNRFERKVEVGNREIKETQARLEKETDAAKKEALSEILKEKERLLGEWISERDARTKKIEALTRTLAQAREKIARFEKALAEKEKAEKEKAAQTAAAAKEIAPKEKEPEKLVEPVRQEQKAKGEQEKADDLINDLKKAANKKDFEARLEAAKELRRQLASELTRLSGEKPTNEEKIKALTTAIGRLNVAIEAAEPPVEKPIEKTSTSGAVGFGGWLLESIKAAVDAAKTKVDKESREIEKEAKVREREAKELRKVYHSLLKENLAEELHDALIRRNDSVARALDERIDFREKFVGEFLKRLEEASNQDLTAATSVDYENALARTLADFNVIYDYHRRAPGDDDISVLQTYHDYLSTVFEEVLRSRFSQEALPTAPVRPDEALTIREGQLPLDPNRQNLTFEQIVQYSILARAITREQALVLNELNAKALREKKGPRLDLIGQATFGYSDNRTITGTTFIDGFRFGVGFELSFYLYEPTREVRIGLANTNKALGRSLAQKEIVDVVSEAAKLVNFYGRAVAEKKHVEAMLRELDEKGVLSAMKNRTSKGFDLYADWNGALIQKALRERLTVAKQWESDIKAQIAMLMGVSDKEITLDPSFSSPEFYADPANKTKILKETTEKELSKYGVEPGKAEVDTLLDIHLAGLHRDARDLENAHRRAQERLSVLFRLRILFPFLVDPTRGAGISGFLPISFEREAEKLPPMVYQYRALKNLYLYFGDIDRIQGELEELRGKEIEPGVFEGGRIRETEERLRNTEEEYEAARRMLDQYLGRFEGGETSEKLRPAVERFEMAALKLSDARKAVEDVNIRLRQLTQKIDKEVEQYEKDKKAGKINEDWYTKLIESPQVEKKIIESEGPAKDKEQGINWRSRFEELHQREAKELLINLLVKLDTEAVPVIGWITLGLIRQQGDLTDKLADLVDEESDLIEKIRDLDEEIVERRQAIEEANTRVPILEAEMEALKEEYPKARFDWRRQSQIREEINRREREIKGLLEAKAEAEKELPGLMEERQKLVPQLRAKTEEKYKELERIIDKVMPGIWQKQTEEVGRKIEEIEAEKRARGEKIDERIVWLEARIKEINEAVLNKIEPGIARDTAELVRLTRERDPELAEKSLE